MGKVIDRKTLKAATGGQYNARGSTGNRGIGGGLGEAPAPELMSGQSSPSVRSRSAVSGVPRRRP